MRILHIAPFNVAGIPHILCQTERKLGFNSRLITLKKHPFLFNEDLCLNLPFITTHGLPFFKKLLRQFHSAHNPPCDKSLPPVRYNPFLQEKLMQFRDLIWEQKYNRFFKTFNIGNFDLYQLDGGSGFYHNARIIDELTKNGKTILCAYYGSDLRVRGIIPEIDALSICNFTFEDDHKDLYPGINVLPKPFDFTNFNYTSTVGRTPVIIGHAPSYRANKGTEYILNVLNELKRSYPIELLLIEHKPYQKALELKSTCCLFIDQISDWGYGLNAVESMAMGIPTFSSLTNYFKKTNQYAPIIEITKDTLKEQLLPFITSPELRQTVGEQSKKWIQQEHDAETVVKKLLETVAKYAPQLSEMIQQTLHNQQLAN